MYEIESTTGYVLSYYNVGEADRRYKILTPNRGVVVGGATSVRKEKSKLKFFLQRYNYIELEYVNGKGGYRFTGGQLLENPTTAMSRGALSVLARVGTLIERLTQDQDEETDLFAIMQDMIRELSQTQQDNATDREFVQHVTAIETWATARVLIAFGYFDTAVIPEISPEIYASSILSPEDVALFIKSEKPLERYTRQCVIETML